MIEDKEYACRKAFGEAQVMIPPNPHSAITVAVSPRTLFNMVTERKIYETEGVEKYIAYQVEHEDDIMMPGDSFAFVKALLTVNSRLRELYPDSEELFDIVLMTNSHAQVAVRFINSIKHHKLSIERFCMTGGQSPISYLKAYNTNLYLSKDPEKVTEAIEAGIAAATMYSQDRDREFIDNQLRVAFDGDAMLFSEDSDKIMKQGGLDRFLEYKRKNEGIPQAQIPLKNFLEALGKLQKKFYAKDERKKCPIRTYLVTEHSARDSGARVIKTLRSCGLEIDEILFAAGSPKGPLVKKIKPHILFNDEMFNIQ